MNKNIRRNVSPYIALLFIMVVIYFVVGGVGVSTKNLTYSEFQKYLKDNKVEEITISPNSEGSTYDIKGKLKKSKKNESFYVVAPLSDDTLNYINSMKEQSSFDMTVSADPASSLFVKFLNWLPYLLLIGAAAFILMKQLNGIASSNNKSMDFGKSRAKLQEDKDKVTFKDVAGLSEEKEELEELIEFLKEPKKFTKMGARIPKGVLLVGPPGTGKTLLAKAVAGEANAPFYFISGSDFVELFVGIGASRVRDMFRQAKQTAPCLIFIDEIDAVGRQRGAGVGGGHDEREQTLNQLLTEMDGFGRNEGIIIIAATNRPDVLDPALLRPGRFDRQITVSLPDAKGREEILEVHAKDKILASDVNLANIAKRTVGFSGADLENLLNEAALLAVRRNKDSITMAEIDEAHDRVIAGPAKKSHKYTEHEKKVVAFHEAGHAILFHVLPDVGPVYSVSIIPTGVGAAGYTMPLPEKDEMFNTKGKMLQDITVSLGGRVAEELIFDDITTGASQDIKQATAYAKSMVTKFGMSEALGLVSYGDDNDEVFIGRDFGHTSRGYGEQVATTIDSEVKRIIDECYDRAKTIIKEHEAVLYKCADLLLEKEKITREEFEALFEE